MKTYEQRKQQALSHARSNRDYWYINNWKYNKIHKYAKHMETYEIFRGSFDEFLIEKGFIDYLNCDNEMEKLQNSM